MESTEDTLPVAGNSTLPSSPAFADTLGPVASESDDTLAGTPRIVRPRGGGLIRGDVVGRFVVLGKLGAGGMGVVYAAYDPELDRKVAVKMLLSSGSAGADARARLLREAQALAKFSHPEIVGVHDVGEHESGIWVAMEFVDGHTLGAWAKQRARTWREVLEVMLAAGRGVAAAHAVGLIHRDLKPDNIMISHDGRVRVMDFGLTRAQGERSVTAVQVHERPRQELLASPLTHHGSLLGTPAYMAPEQFGGGEDVTAQADQFSFCVTLWELLVGERPFGGATMAELAAAVLDGRMRPIPRSKRVPGWLRRTCVRGLARDPAARWPSMDVLLAELARGQSRARFRTAAAVVVGLATLGVGIEGLRRAELAERIAACETEGATIDEIWNEPARARLRQGLLDTKLEFAAETADKLMPWLDDQADAWREARSGACMDATVDESIGWDLAVLDRSRWCLDERRMEFEAVINQLATGEAQVVARAVPAAASLTRVDGCRDPNSLARLPAPPSEQREEVRLVQMELARAAALQATGHFVDGQRVASETLERAIELDWPPLVAAARVRLGSLLEAGGDYPQAELVQEQAYFDAALAGAPELATEAAIGLVSTVGSRLARHADGIRWSRLVEVSRSSLVDPAGLWEANELSRRGNVLLAMGSIDEAREHHTRALDIREAALPPNHPNIATTLNNLALTYEHGGKLEEALAIHQRSLAIREQALGRDHPDVGVSLTNLGNVFTQLDRLDEARQHYSRALDLLERALGPEHPELAPCLNNFASLLDGMADEERAEQLFARALAIKEKTLGPDHPSVATGLSNLANVEFQRGRYSEAKAHQERALAIYEKARGPDHPQLAYPLHGLVDVALVEGRHEDAVALAERALELRVTAGSSADELGEAEFYLARALSDAGQSLQAVAAAERACEQFRGVGDEEALAEVEAWLATHR